MNRVSIELQKQEWKYGRTKNAVRTRTAGECFRSFFEFSQTFTSVSIARQKHGEHVFYFFQKTLRQEKGKQLVNFHYENVNFLCSRHHYVKSSCLFVSPLSYRNMISNQSAPVFSQHCFLNSYITRILSCVSANTRMLLLCSRMYSCGVLVTIEVLLVEWLNKNFKKSEPLYFKQYLYSKTSLF